VFRNCYQIIAMSVEDHVIEAPAMSWRGVFGRLVFCTAVAFGLYAATSALLLTPYIHDGSDAGRVLGVYEAYPRIAASADRARELVLFWGSSMIREGVDCDLLEASDPRLAAYNLSVSGDIPYRRLVELPLVKELRPDRVVIGVSYPELFETRAPFEDQIAVLPPSAYARMPTEAQALLEPRFRKIAGRSSWERFWWKRKFLFSAVFWKLGVPDRSNPIPAGFVENLKTPHVYTKSVRRVELEKFLATRGGQYAPYTSGGEMTASAGASARSLALLVSELENQGTQVVLVNMPLHPLLNDAIPPERRAALCAAIKLLASPRVRVLDCQDAIATECFTDLVHLNAAGRAAFTGMMAGEMHPQPASVAAATPAKSRHEL